MLAKPFVPSILPFRFIAGSVAFAVLGTLFFMVAASMMTGGRVEPQAYQALPLFIHVGTVVPAFFLGGLILVMRKGTKLHKRLGRIWASMMMVTSIASFWMTGLTGGLSPIHIFSVVTLISIPWAIYCAWRGNIEAHKRAMTGPWIGLVIAGLFAFLPGRMLGNMVFGS